ncbi:MAG: VanZ family protein [Muribaculaceae bacterium]|nr:VanZ family protein [Muribaculaceae bacterium]
MKILNALPPWLLSGLCLAAILWLTLAPRPLGDTDIPLFPGADKVAHFLMFGGFVFCIVLDWVRQHSWRRAPAGVAVVAIAAGAGLAGLTEMLQHAMQLGRSFEAADIAADLAGAVIAGIVTAAFLHTEK